MTRRQTPQDELALKTTAVLEAANVAMARARDEILHLRSEVDKLKRRNAGLHETLDRVRHPEKYPSPRENGNLRTNLGQPDRRKVRVDSRMRPSVEDPRIAALQNELVQLRARQDQIGRELDRLT